MPWPKGKKRGPRKPKSEPEQIAARYDPESVAFSPQPVMPAGADPELERDAVLAMAPEVPEMAPARPQKAKRRSRQGVAIDGRWFPCQRAILEGDRFLLLDGGIETRVPVEGVRKIEFVGVALATAPGSAGPVGTVTLRQGHRHTGTSNLRIVDVDEYVNVDPDREREVAAKNRERNAELEALMGAEP